MSTVDLFDDDLPEIPDRVYFTLVKPVACVA